MLKASFGVLGKHRKPMGKIRDFPFVGHPHLKNSIIMTRADDIPPPKNNTKQIAGIFFTSFHFRWVFWIEFLSNARRLSNKIQHASHIRGPPENKSQKISFSPTPQSTHRHTTNRRHFWPTPEEFVMPKQVPTH